MEPVVTVRSASKSYGKLRALDNVSADLAAGEIVALLGPNGAGKTTLVSLILGLRKPTSGSVRMFGLDPRDRRARSRTGVMLQESGLPMYLKVHEAVDLFRSYFPNPLDRERAIRTAGLTEKADAKIVVLSGGQLQRLYFALAICGNPDAMFLDEPTVGMDVEGRRAFWAHVRDFLSSGRTLFFTTHYLEEADAMANRILVINRGQLVADASPEMLKARERTRRVSFDAQIALAFDGLPVERLTSQGNRFRFFTTEPEEVLRALFSRGAQISNLEVVGSTLEEAVIALTSTGSG